MNTNAELRQQAVKAVAEKCAKQRNVTAKLFGPPPTDLPVGERSRSEKDAEALGEGLLWVINITITFVAYFHGRTNRWRNGTAQSRSRALLYLT